MKKEITDEYYDKYIAPLFYELGAEPPKFQYDTEKDEFYSDYFYIPDDDPQLPRYALIKDHKVVYGVYHLNNKTNEEELLVEGILGIVTL